ncbi:transcriptional regulator with XRE-family HTH domain [Streptomyces sp. V4I23]|uniref:helix-turn-helix domain-containing protein n=1 Tax=Streptomyces sp. V4I23 TaxID=3042282 RepID=UPI00278A37AB|nr:helix-turn-helix transcriptional regulator [Streptomyces sp. V4I23]MDQ1005674.1 transcriptional regulator with XRE-family HTH domain [Streptomyces sp. V4I23]
MNDAVSFGRTIEMLRLRRGMTRETLAELIGRSTEWLRQVERQDRPVDRLSVLLRLAEVLHVRDITGFLGLPDAVSRTTSPHQAVESTFLSTLLGHWAGGEDPRSGAESDWIPLEGRWEEWYGSTKRFSLALAALPLLLTNTRVIDRRAWPQGAHEFAETHRFAATVMMRMGDFQLALLAIERGLAAAQVSRKEATLHACRLAYGAAVLDSGLPREAGRIFEGIADSISDTGSKSEAALLAWKGAAYLGGAVAASHDCDAGTMHSLLARARECAGGACSPNLFGPAEVDLEEIRIHLMQSKYKSALKLADHVDFTPEMSRDWRAQFFLMMTQAHLKLGDVVAASFSLLQVEEVSSEEITFNPQARELAKELMCRDSSTVRRNLWPLFNRAGLL